MRARENLIECRIMYKRTRLAARISYKIHILMHSKFIS